MHIVKKPDPRCQHQQKQAGFRNVTVSPRMVYVDASKPELVEGFTKNTFIAMVEGVREQVLDTKMMNQEHWEKGINDLLRNISHDEKRHN